MPEFNLTVKNNAPDIAILYTDGYIDNVAGERIASECFKMLEEGRRRFILNLEKSRIINSLGISHLIEVLERVLEVGGTLAFCGLTSTLARTFRMMGIEQYAKIYANETEALRAM